MTPTPSRRTASWALLGLAVLVTPLLWRPIFARFGPASSGFTPSYLPALEPSRERAAFDDAPVGDLAGMKPGLVIIGDSMAGRIDADRLGVLSGESIAPILQNASGPAYWYLVLKNYVAASGIHPARVLIFFRDTNLTDPMFRIDGAFRSSLDPVAHPREDDLNRVVAARADRGWYAVHEGVDWLYHAERVRAWIEPTLAAWPVDLAVPNAKRRERALTRVNEAFELDRLRPMTQADIAAANEADEQEMDFRANVATSTLPLMLATAREHDLRLCFIRVLRRPENGQPTAEEPALTRYVADLRAYLADHGAQFIDDRDDPELARLPYADGDHVAAEARIPYTERLWRKLR